MTRKGKEMVKTGMLTSQNHKGFTLIEVMVVIVIIGILASIAWPNYQEYIRGARRAEAQSDMLKIQLGLEKWRANNSSYTATLSNVGFTDNNTYYNYAITGTNAGDPPTASVYVIRATAQGGQTADSNCTPLTLNQSNLRGPAGCWKS
jgi:type IV pilus assembly protein PilE